MNGHTLHNVLNMKQRVQNLNTTGIINEECSTYIHMYMNVKVHERAVHRQAHTHTHTHTDAFITNNLSQQQRCYKAAAGHLRHSAVQSTTAIWRPAFRRTILKSRGKHLNIKEQVTNLQFRTVQAVSIISLYFSTAVVLQGY